MILALLVSLIACGSDEELNCPTLPNTVPEGSWPIDGASPEELESGTLSISGDRLTVTYTTDTGEVTAVYEIRDP